MDSRSYNQTNKSGQKISTSTKKRKYNKREQHFAEIAELNEQEYSEIKAVISKYVRWHYLRYFRVPNLQTFVDEIPVRPELRRIPVAFDSVAKTITSDLTKNWKSAALKSIKITVKQMMERSPQLAQTTTNTALANYFYQHFSKDQILGCLPFVACIVDFDGSDKKARTFLKRKSHFYQLYKWSLIYDINRYLV